jgi:2-polyprenyl-3-methyl-5-hydroxy-6-metoxy-1,4-benzoquinol methylase
MAGGVEAAISRGGTELDSLALSPRTTGNAVDLGAGFGMHSIPLARRGFSVTAIDTSADLLSELATHAATLPVRPAEADILSFRSHLAETPEVVLCMGDTLTHLPTLESVRSLLADVAAVLDESGVFVLTFRDYSSTLSAGQRFIPVRSDADRILTCFLEYDEAHVTVHDLLHEREASQWKLRVSSYRKLRLAPDWVSEALENCGFRVVREAGLSGMVRLVARHL